MLMFYDKLRLVIPAQAGIQCYSRQRGEKESIPARTGLGMDSRLRGNDKKTYRIDRKINAVWLWYGPY